MRALHHRAARAHAAPAHAVSACGSATVLALVVFASATMVGFAVARIAWPLEVLASRERWSSDPLTELATASRSALEALLDDPTPGAQSRHDPALRLVARDAGAGIRVSLRPAADRLPVHPFLASPSELESAYGERTGSQLRAGRFVAWTVREVDAGHALDDRSLSLALGFDRDRLAGVLRVRPLVNVNLHGTDEIARLVEPHLANLDRETRARIDAVAVRLADESRFREIRADDLAAAFDSILRAAGEESALGQPAMDRLAAVLPALFGVTTSVWRLEMEADDWSGWAIVDTAIGAVTGIGVAPAGQRPTGL